MEWKRKISGRVQKKWLSRYLPGATMPAHAADCPECGLNLQIPKLRQGEQAHCPRCACRLVRVENEPFMLPPAFALSALILIFLVYSQNFLSLNMAGLSVSLTLPEMVLTMLDSDFGILGVVMVLGTFGMPLAFVLLCIYVYTALISGRELPAVLPAARALIRMRGGLMIDVFFISVLVAYIKVSALAQVSFGLAFWLMLPLALLLARVSVAVPNHWMYYQIWKLKAKHSIFQAASLPDRERICCSKCQYFRPVGETEHGCTVCGSPLFERRPRSIQLSLAFLLAAVILYIPANVMPIMITSNPVEQEVSTIFSGIVLMWQGGDKLVAAIIFSASIAVPTLKIVSMALLQYSAWAQPLMDAEKLSLQYRLTEAVGRWSMIDIFVIIILMNAFATPLAKVLPGPAAVYFCLVVLLTILSAHFFDVRLIWDKRRQNF